MGNKSVTKTAIFANFPLFQQWIFYTKFFITIHGNNPVYFNRLKACSQYFPGIRAKNRRVGTNYPVNRLTGIDTNPDKTVKIAYHFTYLNQGDRRTGRGRGCETVRLSLVEVEGGEKKGGIHNKKMVCCGSLVRFFGFISYFHIFIKPWPIRWVKMAPFCFNIFFPCFSTVQL